MHPLVAEICRASIPIRPDVLRRWQKTLREEVQPRLDLLEALEQDTSPKRGKAKAKEAA